MELSPQNLNNSCSKRAKSRPSATQSKIWICRSINKSLIQLASLVGASMGFQGAELKPGLHLNSKVRSYCICSGEVLHLLRNALPAPEKTSFFLGKNGSTSPKITTAVSGNKSLAALPCNWPWASSGFAQDDLQAAHSKPRGSGLESDNARIGLISRNYSTIARHVFVQKSCSSLKPLASQEQSVPAISSALCLRQLLLVLKLLLPNPHETQSP